LGTQHSSLPMEERERCFPLRKASLSAIGMLLTSTVLYFQLITEKDLKQSALISNKILLRLSNTFILMLYKKI